jgi:hypothetical protein
VLGINLSLAESIANYSEAASLVDDITTIAYMIQTSFPIPIILWNSSTTYSTSPITIP